jgi:hypothetical protein
MEMSPTTATQRGNDKEYQNDMSGEAGGCATRAK